MKRLFVIGNGFDLHHDLNTGFNDTVNSFAQILLSLTALAVTYQSDQVSSRVPCTKLALDGTRTDWYHKTGGKFITKLMVN